MSILGRAFAGAAWLALAGCAMQPPGPPAVCPGLAPAIPAGQARLWFYRDYQPSVSFNVANLDVTDLDAADRSVADRDLSGARMVSVAATGPGVYRDVPPGRYRIMPEDFVSAPNQGTNVTVAPGGTVYLQIEDDPLVWGDMTVFQKDVFTVRPVPATKALAQIAASPQ